MQQSIRKGVTVWKCTKEGLWTKEVYSSINLAKRANGLNARTLGPKEQPPI